MAGVLDRNAPSIEAEYARYIDGDVLGKILFKNFWLNKVGGSEEDIRFPVGRFGDVGLDVIFSADAQVKVDGRWRDVEIKLARVNIANRTLGQVAENWGFAKLLLTPSKKRKKYDILFAVGVRLPGLENPEYWSLLRAVVGKIVSDGYCVSERSLPHEADYMSFCGIFCVPYSEIGGDYFRVTVGALGKRRNKDWVREWFSWGMESERCAEVWKKTVGWKKRLVPTLISQAW